MFISSRDHRIKKGTKLIEIELKRYGLDFTSSDDIWEWFRQKDLGAGITLELLGSSTQYKLTWCAWGDEKPSIYAATPFLALAKLVILMHVRKESSPKYIFENMDNRSIPEHWFWYDISIRVD